jgi:hypothetical protein
MTTGFIAWVQRTRAAKRTKSEALLVELRHMHQLKASTDASIVRLQRMKAEGMEQHQRFEEALIGLSVDLQEECGEICWEYYKALREAGL